MTELNSKDVLTTGLVRAADQLAGSDSIEELARRLAVAVRDHLGFRRSSLWLVNEDGDGLRGTFGLDEHGSLRCETESVIHFESDRSNPTFSEHALRLQALVQQASQGLSICGMFQETLFDHRGRPVGEGDVANCTVWDGQRVFAVLCADHLGEKPIHEDELTRLRFLTVLVGPIIHSIQADAREREAMAKMEQERNLIRRALDAIPHPILIKDRQYRYRYVNRAKRQLLGSKADDVLEGDTSFDHFSAELAQMFEKEESEVMEKGESWLNYKQFTTEINGEPRHYSETKVPLRARDCDDVEGIIIFQADITQLKLISNQLRLELQQQESFFSHIPDRIYFKDRRHRFIRVNQAFLGFCGFSKEEEALGKSDYDLFHESHAAKAWQDEETIMKSGEPLVGIVETEHSLDGRKSWVSTTKMPLYNPEGDIIGTFGMSRDITEMVLAQRTIADSEQLFRSIWQNTKDGMRLTDENGLIVSVNPGFCRIYGVAESEVVGQPLTCLYPNDDPDELLAAYRRRFAESEPTSQVELTRTLPDRREHVLEMTFSWFTDSSARTRFLTVVRDITDRRDREEAKLQMERRLLSAQRLESLGIMAGGIAHDFNNMLAGILANVSLIQTGDSEPAPFVDELNSIERTCMKAAGLCQQMLAYSGRGKFETEVIDLNDLIRESEPLLRASIDRRVVLEFDLGAPMPPMEADASQIKQILLNLAINASEAIGERSGRIRIRTASRSMTQTDCQRSVPSMDMAPGDFVMLIVEDDGSGIEQEHLTRIFDPFFTTKFTGRGLGLAAVMGIVKGHHGGVSVASESEGGACFEIFLPATHQDRVPRPDHDESVASETSGSGTVLLIDDDETIRTVMSEVLRRMGYEVVSAADGLQGLDCFKETPARFDIVLLDLTMPGMDGDQVFEEMQRLDPTISVLLMSGYSERDVSRRFADKKLAGFLQKPFRPAALQAKLRELLDHRS